MRYDDSSNPVRNFFHAFVLVLSLSAEIIKGWEGDCLQVPVHTQWWLISSLNYFIHAGCEAPAVSSYGDTVWISEILLPISKQDDQCASESSLSSHIFSPSSLPSFLALFKTSCYYILCHTSAASGSKLENSWDVENVGWPRLLMAWRKDIIVGAAECLLSITRWDNMSKVEAIYLLISHLYHNLFTWCLPWRAWYAPLLPNQFPSFVRKTICNLSNKSVSLKSKMGKILGVVSLEY